MSQKNALGLGLIGCGDFGRFCLGALADLPEVRIVGVADSQPDAAQRCATAAGVRAFQTPADLIECEEVNIVHLATPPATHHELALAAVAAGKHVLCEKPLALTVAQADEMLQAARQAGVIMPVNFVLRYAPVTALVKAVINSGVLGKVLAGRLTNCAKDTPLPPGHWFWDKAVSGGIFIEHGVHFFDLYRYWLGEGRVLDGHVERREGTGQVDRAICTVRHEGGALVNHYHGFDQLDLMDRTDHRLVCELGDIYVEGWIPLGIRIDAAVDEEGAKTLRDCCGDCQMETLEQYPPDRGNTVSRGRPRRVSRRIRLSACPQPDKLAAYRKALRDLLADQILGVRDPSHSRVVTESNGREALVLAEAATDLADS